MSDLDTEFCFPCSSCLAKYDSLRLLRKHVCGLIHNFEKDDGNIIQNKKVLDDQQNSDPLTILPKANTQSNSITTSKYKLKEINKIVNQKSTKISPQEMQKPFSELNHGAITKPNETCLECASCQKIFSGKIIYHRHQWLHNKNKGRSDDCLPCTEHDCSELFWKSEHLDLHKSRVHGINRVYNCDSCPYSNRSKFLAKSHQENKHLKLNLNSYICTECGEGFNNKPNLEYHIKKKNATYNYKCEQCDYKTIFKDRLKAHMQRHGNKMFRYICSECGKGFIVRAKLKYHMSTHTGERNFKCSFCEMRFNLKSTLKRHENIHLNIKPYECNMCPKKFGGHSNLQVHIKRHMGQKDYVCSTCEKGFIEPAGLRNHRCPRK